MSVHEYAREFSYDMSLQSPHRRGSSPQSDEYAQQNYKQTHTNTKDVKYSLLFMIIVSIQCVSVALSLGELVTRIFF